MKNPAFLFYPSDFIIGTMDMTDEEVGRYIRLLCRQFEQGSIDAKFMSNLAPIIASKFKKDRKGNYYNTRLRDEINKRKKYSESRRSNRSKVSQSKKHMKNISETYEKHMENENINENENENINENENNIISYIVSYLNLTCKTRYKASSEKTKKLIKARMKEGFTLDDFKTVIDKKSTDWKGTEYEKFLRPETLFGTKFEGYLNQTIKAGDRITDFYKMANEWADGGENDKK